MEQKSEKNIILQPGNGLQRYDKRLILEIVKQVEEGVPRRLLKEEYGLGKSALGAWMKEYGSEVYHQSKRKAYSNLEKSAIVAAVKQGRMTVKEAQVAYQISSEGLIRQWIRSSNQERGNFSLPTKLDMAKRLKTAHKKEPDDAELRKELEEAKLKIIALNTLIDVAEEELKINIRKKSGAKRSLE